jgi:N-acetylmuramoyl-L-alanine amidase
VDDTKAIQCIQFNRVAWHGGDTSGPCNMRRIAIEMCVASNSNVEKAYQNACELHGYLNAKLGLPWETELHQACAGKWCSAWVLNRGKKPEMKQLIAQHTNRFKGAPAPAPTLPKPIAAPSPLRDVLTADGAPLLVFNQKRQLQREVTTRMWAQKQGTIVAPGSLPKGREVHVSYLCEGDDGKVWVITQEGWRFHADALVA